MNPEDQKLLNKVIGEINEKANAIKKQPKLIMVMKVNYFTRL
jgi:hypothetical protein